MCDCKKRVREGLEKAIPEAKAITLPIELLSGKIYIEFAKTVEVKGKLKDVRVPMTVSYCPFCGEKY